MKLHVVCQDCEKGTTVNTEETTDWSWYVANEVLHNLDDYMDWEFWLCPECQRDIPEEHKEREKHFRNLLYGDE